MSAQETAEGAAVYARAIMDRDATIAALTARAEKAEAALRVWTDGDVAECCIDNERCMAREGIERADALAALLAVARAAEWARGSPLGRAELERALSTLPPGLLDKEPPD